jgi:hypothetical protein
MFKQSSTVAGCIYSAMHELRLHLAVGCCPRIYPSDIFNFPCCPSSR